MKQHGGMNICGFYKKTYLTAIQWSLFHDSKIRILEKFLIEKRFLQFFYLVLGIAEKHLTILQGAMFHLLYIEMIT